MTIQVYKILNKNFPAYFSVLQAYDLPPADKLTDRPTKVALFPSPSQKTRRGWTN